MTDTTIRNPFKPTAGKNPPQLIGRDAILQDFVEGLHNGPGAPGRLMRVTGMHGTGKTVVLNALGELARNEGWTIVDETALPGVADRMVYELLSRETRTLSIEPTLHMGPLDLSVDAKHVKETTSLLREALNECLEHRAKDAGVLFLLDEVQVKVLDELSYIAATVQHAIREDKNVAFVFAGLPSAINRFVSEPSMTFLRRATLQTVGMLNKEDVRAAMRKTIEDSGLHVRETALELMVQATQEYPFMVQLVGYHAWQEAYGKKGPGAIIDQQDAVAGIARARRAFDQDVIEPALAGLSGLGLLFLLAMSVDDGPTKTADVAKRLSRPASSLGKYREMLLRDSLIVAPRRGYVDLSMPYLRDYLRSNREQIQIIAQM